MRLFKFLGLILTVSSTSFSYSIDRLTKREEETTQKTDCESIESLWKQINSDATNCCDIDGINCDDDNRITKIILNDKGLIGTIPSEIENLTNLKYLVLSDNQLTGNIPSEIRNLKNLISLNLRFNKLTGSIPSEIGNLSQLEELYLSDNYLIGDIPESVKKLNKLLSKLMNNNCLSCDSNTRGCEEQEKDKCKKVLDECRYIESLWKKGSTDKDINCCEIEGIECSVVDNEFHITSINLANKGLTGTIPSDIGRLSKLQTIDLSNNDLNGSIPVISSLDELTTFDLSNNCINCESIKDKSLQNGNEMTCANTLKKNSCEFRCGEGIGECPEGQCCSAKGYCGTTSGYCSLKLGCQDKYGKCAEGRCGELWGSCLKEGECCSAKGYCGTTRSYCKSDLGCQNKFGSCWE
ncbi:L domain-like protein [Piromyces finnis]|uniref:L domain-like protein n=1 Tax=Piromyces finnis TaxID=1754191 RepID=A0A1Y1UWJ4_9FUNG|nr:L domain-like protein [Piromyces finnis]|eukprot:ORX42340.1 L domain-like protein [Piromyces finnis]